MTSTLRSADHPAPAPLAGLVVLTRDDEAGARLAAWGARWQRGEGPDALRAALAGDDPAAVLHLPPRHLPLKRPGAIADCLTDGQDHVGPDPEAGWCITPATARRVLDRLPASGEADLHLLAATLARNPAPPPCHVAPQPLGLPDLPAAFASGRPFGGPFDAEAQPLAVARAAAMAEGRARRPAPPRLPAGLETCGPAPAPRPGEILAFLVTRNEALRLPDALASLRGLGVDRVLVVDNGSTDRTRDIARAAGAHLILAEGDYAASNFGVTWTNAVLDAWARGHWVLVVDADEQLVYPGSDRAGLPRLTAHLDALGSEALRTVMLDCYPDGPLSACTYAPGEPLTRAAPMFDVPRLRREAVEDFPYSLDYGGIRETLFFPEADPRRPARWLHQKLFNLGWRIPPLRRSPRFRALAPPPSPTVTKVPLLRWREGAALIGSTHRLAPMAMATQQPTGVLLHFKFLQDFHARAEDAVARGAHWDGSREYRRYLARLEADPRFSLAGASSLVYSGPDQLVALGVMHDTAAWQDARG
ncbi:glycosyltransferase family 2 protein [Falsiroseomonas sp. CW058]|uniref:glycosyltransferase family 2 protein n=1 Tax=Falsiroseomonas sp. CW058 TaxID=3388664 RepID=UPI003D318259